MKNLISRNRHCVWLLYMVIYFLAFHLAEKCITDNYWVSYLPLDDKIPFVRHMVYPYIAWYGYMYAIGIYLLIKDPDGFRRYMITIALGYSVTVAFCFIFPNGQNLRPEVTGTDLPGRIIAQLYSRDTNTNVLPSMHVLGTLDVVFAVFQCRRIKNPIIHIAATVMAVLICASTVMIKQHSILDVMAAVALSGVIYLVVYVIFGKKRYPDLSGAKVVCFIESIASFGNKKTKSRPKREKRVPILPYEGV